MKVTAIVASTKTLTVIRNVAPNCLGYINQNGVAAPPQSLVTLLKPVYDTVQMVGSVTKQAAQGCSLGPVLMDDNAGSQHQLAEGIDGTETLWDLDDVIGTGTDFVAGNYYKLGTEMFQVTSVDDANNRLTVVRNFNHVCRDALGLTGAVAHLDNAIGFQQVQVGAVDGRTVSSGSCAIVGPKMAEANDGGFATTDTAFTYDSAVAAYPFVVGEFINAGVEYMLVTGVSKTSATDGTVTVVRNVNPPCLTSTIAQHADDVAINKVVSGGCYSIGSRLHTNGGAGAANAVNE